MTADPVVRPSYPVLVVDAHERMALAVIRSLGRAGYRVHACSPQATAIGCFSSYASRAATCPVYGTGEFVPWLRAYCDAHGIRCVVPSEPFLLEVRPAYGEFSHLLPLSDDESTVYAGMSKWSLFFALDRAPPAAAANLPRHLLLRDRAGLECQAGDEEWQQLSAPLFVKTDGCHGHDPGVGRIEQAGSVDSAKEAATGLLDGFDRVLVQEWVSGVGVGAFVLRWRGQVLAQFMHRRLHELPGSGWSSYRESWWHQRIMDDALAKLAHLNWEGVAMMEYRWDADSDTFRLIEMNGRFWGSLHLALYAGVDFPVLLADAFLGLGAGAAPVARQRVRCLNNALELRFILSRFRDPDTKAFEALRSAGEGLCLMLDPRVESDFWFPGDRKLFWIALAMYVRKAARGAWR